MSIPASDPGHAVMLFDFEYLIENILLKFGLNNLPVEEKACVSILPRRKHSQTTVENLTIIQVHIT